MVKFVDSLSEVLKNNTLSEPERYNSLIKLVSDSRDLEDNQEELNDSLYGIVNNFRDYTELAIILIKKGARDFIDREEGTSTIGLIINSKEKDELKQNILAAFVEQGFKFSDDYLQDEAFKNNIKLKEFVEEKSRAKSKKKLL